MLLLRAREITVALFVMPDIDLDVVCLVALDLVVTLCLFGRVGTKGTRVL